MSSTQPSQQPQTLEEWTELLRVEELPIFSSTAQRIYAALDDKKKGAMELASIILQDPSLTAKLLRVSNSPYYNPTRQKISTVSRSVVMLGVAVIQELTLACSFFEAILSSFDKERANKEIAYAIHSAVQAREMAILMRDDSPEEVFIAALLHNIGHIAFWCSSHKHSVETHKLITSSELEQKKAEKEVLGFTLAQLGKKLSKSWCLGGLIVEAMCYPDSPDRRIQTVRMGSRICDAITQGWDSSAMSDCLAKLEQLSGLSGEVMQPKLKANIAKAVDIARQFGAHDASRFINPEIPSPTLEPQEEYIDRKQIQFQVMQDITSHISGKIDLNVLLEMALEGVHRGVDMDRSLFMLLGPDKKSLNEKISLGWQNRVDAEKIRIGNNDVTGNLLFQALSEQAGLWFRPQQHSALYTKQIEQYFGRQDCFVFPIQVEQKPIGLIYCDRAVSKRALSAEDFSAAEHFAKQAQIGLILYRMQNH